MQSKYAVNIALDNGVNRKKNEAAEQHAGRTGAAAAAPSARIGEPEPRSDGKKKRCAQPTKRPPTSQGVICAEFHPARNAQKKGGTCVARRGARAQHAPRLKGRSGRLGHARPKAFSRACKPGPCARTSTRISQWSPRALQHLDFSVESARSPQSPTKDRVPARVLSLRSRSTR